MKSEVLCLIGTSTPAEGYSRTPGVGSTMGLAWCLGEPRRKKHQSEVGVSQDGGVPWVPCLPPPPLSRSLALEVRWDWRISFHGNREKSHPPTFLSGGSLVQVVRGHIL